MTSDLSKTGILLLSHGSRLDQGKKVIEEYTQMYKEEFPEAIVEYGFMEMREPNIPQSINKLTNGNDLEKIIDRIDYEVGCHVLNYPSPDDNNSDDCIVLCHYKWINFDFIAERHKYFATRLSQNNIDKQWGIQYVFPHEKMINNYNTMKKDLVQIFT